MNCPTAYFVLLACVSTSQLRADAIGTHWIGARRSTRATTIQKRFALDSLPPEAVLRIAVDFAEVDVQLNGRRVLTAHPLDLPIPRAVHRWCVDGDNELVLHVRGDGGPTAVAVEFKAAFDDRSTRIVRSDASWQVRTRDQRLPVEVFGRVDFEPWWSIQDRPSTNAFDEYNQWQEANSEREVNLQVPANFAVDVVYQVPKQHGSWISMVFDDRGRLFVGKEKQGILRLTLPTERQPARVESVDDNLLGCHGLVWSNGVLLANASDSRALYRLADTVGDDTLDEIRRLRSVPGGRGDHGRNNLTVGPDGAVYSIHGDAVDLPDGFTSRVPETIEFQNDHRPRGGHLIRTDHDGSVWEVVAAGLRNPYGIAFNKDGEPFTYDADSERHVGLPWYRPTRMNHLVPGTDYGWRARGELPWPIYHADILPPNVLIGRGSPTAVRFGYASNFPRAYRQALFAADWAFGRIFAVHLVPRGATYSMHPETFLRGRPLNVTDIQFGPDGHMYLLTGGYQTRSTLYRVRYTGRSNPDDTVSRQVADRAQYSRNLRALRRQLEQRQRPDESAVEFCWPYLAHPDRWIRHAARIALEHQSPESWQQRVWSEQDPAALLPALLALVRVSTTVSAKDAWSAIDQIPFATLPTELQRTVVRIATWLSDYHEPISANPPVLSQFEDAFPSGDRAVDREICSLLGGYHSKTLVSKTLRLFATELQQQDALHYLMVLSKTRAGWSDASRDEFFRLVQGARLFMGDERLPEILQQLEADALATVPKRDRPRFAALLVDNGQPDVVAHGTPRAIVQTWTGEDFAVRPSSNAVVNGELGRQVFHEAQCASCHRLGTFGKAFGPDLTGIANRYQRDEIVQSIFHPSRVIPSRFANHVVVTEDGQVHTGQVVWDGFRKSTIRIATDPLRMDKTIEISKHDIQSQHPSPVSPMPKGLLDTFQRHEIESLLAFMEQGGVAKN